MTRSRFLKAFALAFVAAIVLSFLLMEHRECEAYNDYADEGNKRGAIIEEFLLTARKARLVSAQEATSPAERESNQRTADRYQELADSLEQLPLQDCSFV